MSGFNILDLTFITITVFSIIIGIIRGFIKEVLSLVFLILSIIIALLFYSNIGGLFREFLKNRNLANIAAFITIFTLMMIGGYIFTYLIKKIIVIGPVKSIDRLLGAVFGLLRGVILSAVLLFGIVYMPIKKELIINSKISPHLYDLVKFVKGYLPDDLKSLISKI